MSKAKIWTIVAVMSVALVGIAAMEFTWIKSMIELNIEHFDESVFSALNATSDRLEKLESLDAYVNGYSIDYFERSFGDSGNKSNLALATQRTENIGAVPGHKHNCTCRQCYNSRMDNWQQYMKYSERALDAPLESRLDPAVLDTILRQELADRGLKSGYSYGIFSKQRRNFIIIDGNYIVGDQGPIDLVDELDEESSLGNSEYAVYLYDDIALQPPGLLMIHFPGQSRIVMGPVWLTILLSGLLLCVVLGCFAYSIFIIFRQKKLSTMKNDFISNMTHEFKTPIATISLAADSITNPKVSGSQEKLERFAGIIRQENNRMHRQVEKVLQAAQIDRKEFKLKPISVDLNELLAEAVTHMGLQVEKLDGKIETSLVATNSVVVADRTHLSNILHNLMDNAIKYSENAPFIKVRTEDTKTGVKVSISDHGIGMTKEDQNQIFEKFFRVHTGNRHDVKGFGLGLSYVKAIVDAHGGKVTVDSKLGEGSTFSVEFPRKFSGEEQQ
jgi:two-component system phosphate regulon sensor histidine kinase PhoR